MVHTFKCLDEYFLLDSESGSVFLIDRPAHLACKILTGELAPTQPLEKDIQEALDELDTLKKQGVIFCEPPKPSDITYSDEIKSMCLNISHRCNLRCKYCFAQEGSYGGKAMDMSAKIARLAIDFLIKHSGSRRNLEADFFGGEPLLNFEVVKDTVQYALAQAQKAKKSFRFTITTNGTIYNAEQIKFINDNMSNVVISIDGRKDTHNFHRSFGGGQGSYEKALKFAQDFRHIRDEGEYYIRGTFTSRNLDFVADVLSINDSGFDQISIEPVVLPQEHPLAIRQEHIDAINQEYEKLAREYLKRRKSDKWFNFFHFMIDFEGGPCEKKRVSACSAGNEYIAVAPDGLIYPCHQFVGNQDFVLGDLKKWDTTQIMPLNQDIRRKFQASNIHSKPKCQDCFAKYYCSGGCAANNHNYNGDINEPLDIMCRITKKRTECAIAVNILERVQAID
ncbi:MAG TPA: thioether cross-link-forming SCIFF peptide maturase [Clostridiales bacterium]|nr:thioether cross-link-forming SCIFF peptide maturase [Clostridiales bacterium]